MRAARSVAQKWHVRFANSVLAIQEKKKGKEDEIGYVDYHFDPDAFKKTTYNHVRVLHRGLLYPLSSTQLCTIRGHAWQDSVAQLIPSHCQKTSVAFRFTVAFCCRRNTERPANRMSLTPRWKFMSTTSSNSSSSRWLSPCCLALRLLWPLNEPLVIVPSAAVALPRAGTAD